GASLPTDGASLCGQERGAVPIQIVNGTRDLVNPYAGGEVLTLAGRSLGTVRSTEATARHFRERSDAEVRLVPIQGGGHTIPGPRSRFPRVAGRVDRTYAGVQEAADFLQRHLRTHAGGRVSSLDAGSPTDEDQEATTARVPLNESNR
ncbi:MAG TPA: hypothetical protein VK966_04275, partial [Longimicrobiales bacterium]|nr:hypothetical protein [Longimicrobiales bacterium]